MTQLLLSDQSLLIKYPRLSRAMGNVKFHKVVTPSAPLYAIKETNDKLVGSNEKHSSICNVIFNNHRLESYTVVYILETWPSPCD